jgi:hypothetical protein
MRTALGLAFLALLIGAFPLHAQEVTGRVRAIYYEAARGVLVDPKMLRRPSAVRWVDVELQSRETALVQLPSTLDAKVGDLVAVQLASPKSIQVAHGEPMRVSRVTEVRTRASQLALPGK